MKFPFDFSLSLVFRLVFPGMVLAVALWPVTTIVLKSEHIAQDPKLILPIVAVIFGWLIILADQPIYQIYEGRLGWPGPVRRWATKREQERLQTAFEEGNELYRQGEVAVSLEYDLVTLDFPLNDDGDPYAAYPTRLGNLITASETYSKQRWGIDAIFYWPRLWAVLDKDLKSSLDEQQAIADSALYVSFTLTLSAIIFFGYSIGGFFAIRWRLFDLPDLPSSPFWTLAIAASLQILAYAIYVLSLYQQRVYGELFRAIFDQYRDKLAFVNEAAEKAYEAGVSLQDSLDKKYAVSAMLLRWNYIRPKGHSETTTPQAWAKRKAP